MGRLFSANCLGVHPLFSAIGGRCRRMVCIASYPKVAIQVIFLPSGRRWRMVGNSERTHWLPFIPQLPLLHYRFLMAWVGCVYVLIPHRVFLPYFPLFPPFESFICSHILFLLPPPPPAFFLVSSNLTSYIWRIIYVSLLPAEAYITDYRVCFGTCWRLYSHYYMYTIFFFFRFYSGLYFYVHSPPHAYRHLVTCYVCQIFAIPEEKHSVSCLWVYWDIYFFLFFILHF